MKLTNVFIIKQFVSTLVRIVATKLNDHVGTEAMEKYMTDNPIVGAGCYNMTLEM